ncbi:hypothetical protein LPB140_01655 [Sphingorhabdus lutea]|uniref:Cell wall hydrolase SleB domain-containing protein n=1 Tax=Sphingorhabdus lutea TaxID=1913578 RepID=A0A1L3JEB0_9SPHN|nr:hypothetical protein LPB140_01655 [Sphingorhabdus lutea]
MKSDNKESAIIFKPGTGSFVNEVPKAETENSQQDIVEDANGASSLQELVSMQNTDINLSEEMHCLAGTIFFESKGESLAGQLAVAKVVLNRASSGRFPGSICGVVYQRSQFSFVRGGKMPKINTSKKSWKNAVAIAQIAMNDSWDSKVENALYFHATHVSPGWRKQRIGRIDNHVFYR